MVFEDKYCKHAHITCYRADHRDLLRPDAFLDMAQQIAVEGADSLHFGDDQLKERGCVWVLARQHVVFDRPMHFKERGRLVTWHRGIQGLFFVRDYMLLDGAGNPAVRSTSSWVVMNYLERRAVRADFLSEIVSTEPQSPDSAIEALAEKVNYPRNLELEKVASHVVRYSDVDHNEHANNVKYTVWAMDALPEELVYNHRVKELTINFNKEARPGDVVDLYHLQEADGSHIIEGRTGEHQVFIERLRFD